MIYVFSFSGTTADRIFSDEVFAAELEGIEDASAFLLGIDIGVFATDDEATIVQRFLDDLQVPAEELAELDPDDSRQRDTQRLQ